ncbi:hypothetical protein MMC25_005507 [Agyrium rufum]|nr:hypothetical protein [Agyrium rufum]
MQSTPTDASQQPSNSQVPQNHTRPTQHGFDEHYEEPRLQSYEPDSGAVSRRSSTSTSARSQHSVETDGTQHSTDRGPRGMKEKAGDNPTSNRITAYEKATSSRSARASAGPSFHVVTKPEQSRPATSILSTFPNEVLTHILSYLPPDSLSAASLVSRRFHELVTTPHAWRIAFTRYFCGAESTLFETEFDDITDAAGDVTAEQRVFTRLTTLASWRSEYIVRTRLLRSITRGKPADVLKGGSFGSPRAITSQSGNAQITYSSNLFSTVNHLHATFGTTLNRRIPRFVHGADEGGAATSSDPNNGRTDSWGLADPRVFIQFADIYPGEALYGLGAGDIVGVPNVMDVSQLHGMIYGEGIPGGKLYFRSTSEQRGRTLLSHVAEPSLENGIPRLIQTKESMTAVWIARSNNVPSVSEGLIGILSGSSYGVLSAYSLGTDDLHERRIAKGELTVRWALSPGVPIVCIVADDNVTEHRIAKNRIWAVAVNALGEVFYLTHMPMRHIQTKAAVQDDNSIDALAWATGHRHEWSIIHSTQRQARPDPFISLRIMSPSLSHDSRIAEVSNNAKRASWTRQAEEDVKLKPHHLQNSYEGWDMQRRLEVDFGGSATAEAGEGIFVICCGLQPEQVSKITRYCRLEESPSSSDAEIILQPPNRVRIDQDVSSVFGATQIKPSGDAPWRFPKEAVAVLTPVTPRESSPFGNVLENKSVAHWQISRYTFGDMKNTQIAVSAIDRSIIALTASFEDPLLVSSASSITSSPSGSPLPPNVQHSTVHDVPGQRDRFLAVGTKTGTVIVWSMRVPGSRTADLVKTIDPIRIIHTDSPQISSLAISSLYLVHGGNDGLVQAWDPLASTLQPIRTLHSRFSTRARRRLMQAEASPQGVGINLFAAGAIYLDPDPTVLRGMVTLGTHLRYWSYSSSGVDQYKGSKRRLRRSERGSNQTVERFTGSSRGALKDYIANERVELEREQKNRDKERSRLAGRYGLDLLGPGATDEELLAYAALLSEEAAQQDQARVGTTTSAETQFTTERSAVVWKDTSLIGFLEHTGQPSGSETTESDAVIAQAMQDALDAGSGSLPKLSPSFPIRYSQVGKSKRSPSSSPPSQASAGFSRAGSNTSISSDEAADLDFALSLALADEQLSEPNSSRSRKSSSSGSTIRYPSTNEEFPALPSSLSSSPTASKSKGKGKGKAKGRATRSPPDS